MGWKYVKTQSVRNAVRESAKLRLRGGLGRVGVSVGTDPYASRLTRTLTSRGMDTVLDIGANVGQYSRLLRSAGYQGRIISVEPLTEAYAQLSRRARRDADWMTVNSAVGAEPGEVEINVSGNSFSSSILPMNDTHLSADPESAYVSTQKVPVTTVQALVAEHRIEVSRSLLKVDTQGYEAEVLAGTGDLLGQFGALQLELSFVELYEGQKLYEELSAHVQSLGFTLWSIDPGISASDGRMLQCDGLFVRDGSQGPE